MKHYLSKIPALILVLLITSYQAIAQDISVSGTVTTSSGETLPGVAVSVKGTTNGVVTDINGQYKISADANTVLVFSFLGYTPEEETVGNRSILNMVLFEDITNLQEVVVVGYGTQQKKDITGSVSVVNAKEMASRPNTQVSSLIQGKAAGVQILSSSGKPSAGLSIRIRGTNTINTSSEPLYVIDGVPTGDTRSLNPSDVESVTILKDASSAAIYGAQGANGVVLITTKQGKKGKAKFEFNTYTGFSSVWKTLPVLNSEQYRDLMTEMGYNTDWSLYTANTDWQKEIFQRGSSQNYQLSMSGQDDKTTYYVSGGWVKQEGSVRSSEMDRYNFKVNLDQKATDWLTVGTRVTYTKYSDVDVSDNSAVNQGGVILGMLSTPSVIGVYKPDGMFTSNPFQNWENPMSSTDAAVRGYNNERLLGNVYAEATFFEGLKFKSNFGIDNSHASSDYFLDPFRTSYGVAMKGIGRYNAWDNSYYIWDNTLNYSKGFGNHKMTALVGSVIQKSQSGYAGLETRGFSSDQVITPNAGSTIVSATANKSETANASFISRVTYDFQDKYLVTANFRIDGSSKFGPDLRFGYFPSVSLGWRLSQENFLKGIETINDLKLRVGYGLVGNDNLSGMPYGYLGQVSPGGNYPIGGIIQSGNYPSSIQNNKLKWEESEQTNVGIDLAILNSRLNFTVDAYIRTTNDLLLAAPLPRSTGFDNALQNIGSIQNKGIEFSVSSRNLVGELTWDTDFNISFNRNEVIDLVGQELFQGGIASRGEVVWVREGLPLGTFYGYVAGGVDPATGDAYYIDKNGESTFTPAPDDRRIIGDANPDFTYGLTNNLSFKGLTLSMFIQGSQGNDIFNATRIETEAMIDPKNQSTAVLDRWRKPGDITDIPRVSNVNNSRASSRFIEDGSYLRIKALTLGYELPKVIMNSTPFSSVRIYATGENLLTFTKYSGFDPEVNAFGGNTVVQGVDYGTYPQSRTLILGLNITL